MKYAGIVYSAGTLEFLNSANTVPGYYRLFSWIPTSLVNYKDGGVFRDSKSSPHRKPAYRVNASYVETMTISVHGNDANHVAQLIRALKTMADEAFDYWRADSSIANPAYLKSAAGLETVYRYAPIYKVDVAGLTDLHFDSYEGGLMVNGTAWSSGFTQIILTIERGEWSDKIPGTYSSLISATAVFNQLNAVGNTITHIYRWDASTDTFSSNLFGTTKPYALWPNPSEANDVLFIGASAPFSALFLDIGTVGVGGGIGQGYYISDGGSYPWSEMAEGSIVDGTASFSLSGPRSITIDLGQVTWIASTVNGVSRYWLALGIQNGGWATIPTQANTDPTSAAGDASASISVIGGDMEALARATIIGASAGGSNRILFGTREIVPSDAFQGYLNISDNQDNADITCVRVDENDTTMGAIADHPAGTGIIFAPNSSLPLTHVADLTIGDATTPSYKGKFRWFIRTKAVNSGDSFNITVKAVVAGVTSFSKTVNVTNNGVAYVYADLGYLNLYDNNPNFSSDDITFEFWISADNAGTLYLYDLVFTPASLTIVDSQSEVNLQANRYMLLDSIVSPRDDVLAGMFNVANDRRMGTVSAICNGKFTLPHNKSMQLWLTALDADGIVGTFDLDFSATIAIDVAKQYAFVRHDT